MPTKKQKPRDDEVHRAKEALIHYLHDTQRVRSPLLEEAFRRVPREKFIAVQWKMHAYEDAALPSQNGQTISQPSTIADMLETLDVKEGMNVLEVGSGTGYVCALLSHMVGKKGHVHGMERDEELAKGAHRTLHSELKLKNVEIHAGDGALGLEQHAPFDRILVSCACPYIPPALFKQLKEKGRIIAPVGDDFTQQMVKMEKWKGKLMKSEIPGNLYEFVPLVSKTLKGFVE